MGAKLKEQPSGISAGGTACRKEAAASRKATVASRKRCNFSHELRQATTSPTAHPTHRICKGEWREWKMPRPIIQLFLKFCRYRPALFTILWDPSAGQPSPSHEGRREGGGRRPRIGQPRCGASVRRAAASCCHTCLCAASRALARRCCCWLQRCCCFRLQRGAGAAGGRGRPRLRGKPREKRVNTARLICCTRPPSSLLPSERSHRSCRRSWASCSSKSSCYLSPSLPFLNTIS